MTILDQLARHAMERVARDKEIISPEEIRALAAECSAGDVRDSVDRADVRVAGNQQFAENGGNIRDAGRSESGGRFYEAVARPGMSFICEVKKASPSKGLIDPVFDYAGIAREYEAAGADAVSCLTEPKWFLGSDSIFREIRSIIGLPMIRKDFIVDEYQLYQSKVMGADCVLLICALLDAERISHYLGLCEDLGLDALVETHDEDEILSAVSAGARMIGVNNRNLKDFSVNLNNVSRLRERIPADRLYVAESGVRTPEDAAVMRKAGADAILVGEALMRAEDKAAFLQAMREAAR